MTQFKFLVAFLVALSLATSASAGVVRRANKQWFISPSVTAVPANVTNYVGCRSGDSVSYSASVQPVQQILAAPVAFTQLGVASTLDIGAAGATLTATLELNGSDTALTCTVTGAGGTESSCTDSTHRVTAVAGDLCAIKVVTSATINSAGNYATYSLLALGARREFQAVQHLNVTIGTATRYSAILGNIASIVTGENQTQMVAPTAATLKAVRCLSVDTSGNPLGPDNGAGSQTWTFTPRANAAGLSGAACVMTETGNTCSVTGLTDAIAAGDLLSMQYVPANTTATGAHVSCVSLLELDRGNAVWLMHSSVSTQTSAGGTLYGSATGMGVRNASGDAVKTLSPVAGTLSNLRAAVHTDPTPGTWTFTQWAGAPLGATALTCPINTGSTACPDTTHSVDVSVGHELATQLAPSSSPASVRAFSSVVLVVP